MIYNLFIFNAWNLVYLMKQDLRSFRKPYLLVLMDAASTSQNHPERDVWGQGQPHIPKRGEENPGFREWGVLTHPTPTPSWDPQAATDHYVAADGRYQSDSGTEEVAAVAMWSLHPGRPSHLHPVHRLSHMDSLCLRPTGPEQFSPHLDLQGLHPR